MTFQLGDIAPDWTLFLDRDGVINVERKGLYVCDWGEFVFMDEVPQSIAYLNSRFARTIVTTNQRGVTKGLMTLADLEDIHHRMQEELKRTRARIDRIYYCLDAEPASPCRKPNPGMALQAAADFPAIELTKSVMVGNNISDMYFGRNAGMATVFVTTTDPEQTFPHDAVDLHFPDLYSFTQALRKA